MKNILVPTDFSACATNALEAAVELSKRFGAAVHLLHCLSPGKQKKHPTQADLDEADQAYQNAMVLLENIKAKYGSTTFSIKIDKQKLPDSIAAYTTQHGIDLVVMGSHGASGQNEFFIGSNTQKVVRKAHLPVLVLKDPLKDFNFSKVVFATSLNQDEKESFAKFKDFVKHFIPEIHLVYINNDPFFGLPYIHIKEILEEWKVLAQPFECQTHYFSAYTIEQGIRALSRELGASLVGISNHHRHPMKRLFAGSNVEALVNHSDLPVLSIDY